MSYGFRKVLYILRNLSDGAKTVSDGVIKVFYNISKVSDIVRQV